MLDRLHYVVTLNPLFALGWLGFQSCLFVWSLYVWEALGDKRASSEEERNTPTVIIWRCISASVVSLILVSVSPLSWSEMGFPSELLVHLFGALFGAFATVLLFIGPVVWLILTFNEQEQFVFCIETLRNYALAPFFEEIVFRSCMLPVLTRAGFSVQGAIWCASIFFGLAHVHLKSEARGWFTVLRTRYLSIRCRLALVCVLLRVVYTTVFGIMAGYLLIRTGTFAAAFISHCLCNYLGLPTLDFVEHRNAKSTYTCVCVFFVEHGWVFDQFVRQRFGYCTQRVLYYLCYCSVDRAVGFPRHMSERGRDME